MALVSFSRVSKSYRLGSTEIHALRDVSLDVDAGETVALWGPSGSGKSTFLNLLAGLDRPSAGTVSIDGRDLGAMSDDALSDVRGAAVGIVFQSFNLIPVLTAVENVMLPLEIHGTAGKDARARAMERLGDVGMQDYSSHRPDQLSGGQQQRIAIARALVTGPRIVIADEPTANLDTDTAFATIDVFSALNRARNVTFVFATHDERLLGRAGRTIRLVDGQVAEDRVKRVSNGAAQ